MTSLSEIASEIYFKYQTELNLLSSDVDFRSCAIKKIRKNYPNLDYNQTMRCLDIIDLYSLNSDRKLTKIQKVFQN